MTHPIDDPRQDGAATSPGAAGALPRNLPFKDFNP